MSTDHRAPSYSRRQAVAALGGAAVLPVVAGCARADPVIVIVGGGFGGATAARYARRYLPSARLVLIEAASTHVTCPFSNTVVAGLNPLSFLERRYDVLAGRYDVQVVHDRAMGVDPAAKVVETAAGRRFGYDRLILSPGIDFRWDAIEGYDRAASALMPHAWKAGEQTVLLRRQLEAMPDGGLVVISVPGNPYRCPPGPYERASLIAHELQWRKPRSKVMILDAKDSFSKDKLFFEGWSRLYPGLIEWVPAIANGRVARVDVGERVVETEFERLRPHVANIIAPQRAADIAVAAGLTDPGGFCPVHPETFESTLQPGIHVIGDAAAAGEMPKSAFSANSQAKLAVAAIASLISGDHPGPMRALNTCYSLLSPDYGISVAGVYEAQDGEIVSVKGAGGVSPLGASAEFRRREAAHAAGWYASICQDSWG